MLKLVAVKGNASKEETLLGVLANSIIFGLTKITHTQQNYYLSYREVVLEYM